MFVIIACYHFFRRLTGANSVMMPHRLISTYQCCTKPSPVVNSSQIGNHYQKLHSIRHIEFSALHMYKQLNGKGVFGKCYSGYISANLEVCVKVFRSDEQLASVFPLEAVLTSQLCHSNLPWLYGITENESHKMLVLSFHSVNERSCTLYKVLHKDPQRLDFDVLLIDWRNILFGLVSALMYLHENNIVHNDIKADNILIESKSSTYHSILIDFGKGCFAVKMENFTNFLSQKTTNIIVNLLKLLQTSEMATINNLSLAMCMHLGVL